MPFNQWDIVAEILLAALLGAVIGFEREITGKAAGLRTYTLVSMGACLFAILSRDAFRNFWGVPGFDPSRIVSQVVVGVGFIGGGLVIVQGGKVRGLTTAAGLWIAAAVGSAVGLGMQTAALVTAGLTVLVLWGLRKVEVWIDSRLTKRGERLPER